MKFLRNAIDIIQTFQLSGRPIDWPNQKYVFAQDEDENISSENR